VGDIWVMSRAQLKHVLMDVDLPNHNKIRLLKSVHGNAGKLAYYELQMAMSKATNATVDKDLIILIAIESEVADTESFFKYLLDKGLIQKESNGFSNTPVIKDQESYFKKLDSDRKRKGKGKESEKVLKDPDIDTDFDIDIDLNKEEWTIPAKCDTPEIRAALEPCLQRLKKNGRELDQIGLDAFFLNLALDPKRILAALTHTTSLTMAKNIYEPPDKSIKPWQKKPEIPPTNLKPKGF
jgi:hypothetical protein